MSEVVLHDRMTELNSDRENLRRFLMALIAVLVCIGIQMVQSASLTSRPSEQDAVFLGRHLMWLAIGLSAAVVASRLRVSWLQQHASVFFWTLIVLLLLVLIPGIGSRINGAQRWFRFAGLSFQPSELGRLILPMMAAKILCEQRQFGYRVNGIPQTLLPLIALPLVILEPDLGATVFLALGFVLAVYLAGWPLRYFLACGVLIVPTLACVLMLKPYQMERIRGFVSAWQDLNQAPWQVRQSLLSLGSGGLSGRGVGGGWQKLSYLPEANTDFVFAVVGEELGLTGTLTVCFIWITVFLAGRGCLAHLPRTSFAWVFGTTLLVQLVFQAMANIAVVTALVPPKGVPHPFISYGGTNLLVSLVAVGLILAMSRRHSPEATDLPAVSAELSAEFSAEASCVPE